MSRKYSLYLASGINLWKNHFSKKYSKYFNRKLTLFEPGTIDTPDDHRQIPIAIACYDLDKINHADALLIYMKYYKSPDNSPIGTDSTWEFGYALSKRKPAIVLIESKEHIDYYASQWMVSFSINAILTTDKEVAEIVKDHPKFVHTTVLLAQNSEQLESKIIEYLDGYYRSIYSRSGLINYFVDSRAREIFSRPNLAKFVFTSAKPDAKVTSQLKALDGLNFDSDKDSLVVCSVERNVSKYIGGKLDNLDSAIAAVVSKWKKPDNHILDCLEHSIKPPFQKVEGRKQGLKKTRPELFYELYDLVTHHLIQKQKFIKSDSFPYEMGAVLELYNWMNTYALDDVFDNSDKRQNLDTVWKKFSRRDAIYTGILGHLLALKYTIFIARESPSIARKNAAILNNYNRMMYEGQVFDAMLTFDSEKKKKILLTENFDKLCDLCIKRMYGICGGFYEAIGEIAAKTENKEEQVMNAKDIDRISPLIGMYYGIIQMIRNDLGDYILPEDFSKLSKGMKSVSHSDIVEGKTDMAYLMALYSPHLSQEEKKFLHESLHKQLTTADDTKINELLWKSGAIDATVEVIMRLIEHVNADLVSQYHETPPRLKWMFDMVAITKEILAPFKKQALKNGWAKYEFDPLMVESVVSQIMKLEEEERSQRLGDVEAIAAGIN